ncbi:MAG: ECF transporter S component [Christensenellales bacterium]
MKVKDRTLKITYTAVCLALCLVLPLLTGQIVAIGNALAPMHIPVLLCGFLCGWKYGAALGFVAPLIRFALFGTPPIMPTGVSMCFELATYGLISGLLYVKLPKNNVFVYVSLIAAMLCGRVVWGVARFVISLIQSAPFTFRMFLSGAFVTAVPGIICHIVLVPVIVFALRQAKLVPNAAETDSLHAE